MIPGICAVFNRAGTKGNFFVTTNPTSVGGSDTAGTIMSDPTAAQPFGGTSPYTYQWMYYTGAPSIAITSATSATTTFSAGLTGGEFVSGQFFCRVTDASSTVVDSNLVQVSLHAIRG